MLRSGTTIVDNDNSVDNNNIPPSLVQLPCASTHTFYYHQ